MSTPSTVDELLRSQIIGQIHASGADPSVLLELLATLVESHLWETTASSFAAFVVAPYTEGGIGWSLADVNSILTLKHRHETLDPFVAERMKTMRREVERYLIPPNSGHGGDRFTQGSEQHDNVKLLPRSTGNTRAAAIARLRRDRSDLAEEVLSGNMSANQAAILAGFRKRAVQVFSGRP